MSQPLTHQGTTMTSRFDPSRRQLLLGTSAAGLATTLQFAPSFARAPMQNAQMPGVYRFKVGAFEATVISDGPLVMGPPQADVFVGLSKDDFVKALNENYLASDNLALEQNTLLLNTGDKLLLFDTGTGASKMMGPHSGKLLANLKAAGVEPKDIDAVILTHAHGDHCWGLMSDGGESNFPNAQIYMTQSDLEFWTDEANGRGMDLMKAQIDGARKNLLPNRDRIVFVKDRQEVVPGVQAIATPGHTVGHMSYVITSQGKSICNGGDVGHHHIVSTQFPRLPFAYDTDGQQAVASRVKLFDMLAAERIPLLAYHFPWPGLGFVAKHGDAYRYFAAPMQTAL
jgi:glyoxylase-like metal-dependent hydrolase (beta-lactamase superfamily II)